jgi:acyl dehydratase
MTVSLSALKKGHEFPPAEFTLSPEWVADYGAAVGAETTGASVPPMAVATLAIRALLEAASLPSGTIHAGQELSFAHPASVGDRLSVDARVASRGERAGWVLMSVELRVDTAESRVMDGRATITFPAEEQA